MLSIHQHTLGALILPLGIFHNTNRAGPSRHPAQTFRARYRRGPLSAKRPLLFINRRRRVQFRWVCRINLLVAEIRKEAPEDGVIFVCRGGDGSGHQGRCRGVCESGELLLELCDFRGGHDELILEVTHLVGVRIDFLLQFARRFAGLALHLRQLLLVLVDNLVQGVHDCRVLIFPQNLFELINIVLALRAEEASKALSHLLEDTHGGQRTMFARVAGMRNGKAPQQRPRSCVRTRAHGPALASAVRQCRGGQAHEREAVSTAWCTERGDRGALRRGVGEELHARCSTGGQA
mmetsp:Transcript_95341/g.153761  ORF Transcript_95341/g.153761 Transcript_95341/m.153761 type:complete len:292 (-) Transcript_95341:40-915(-)